MDIDNGTDTVTITLTRAEANSLRVDLMDLDPSRVCSRTMIQGLIEGLEEKSRTVRPFTFDDRNFTARATKADPIDQADWSVMIVDEDGEFVDAYCANGTPGEALDKAIEKFCQWLASEAIAGAALERAAREADWPDDPEMQKMLRDDADDLRHIARQVSQGFISEAMTATANLDTAVREDIPECAYPYVGLRSLR